MKPDISYPCAWEYRIIGENLQQIEYLATHNMPREYTLKTNHTSRNGRFISVHLQIIVQSEEEKNHIFSIFSADKSVKMVI